MIGYAQVPMGEICEINPCATKVNFLNNPFVSFVPMAAVDERLGTITRREERPISKVSRGYTPFQNGDVLFAKITPCMENGKAAVARDLTNGMGRGSTEFHVLRPGNKVLGEFVYYFVRQPWFRELAKRSFTGTAGQKRVPKSFMENVLIPLPPLDEQRRIVGLLTRATRIERLRGQVQEKLQELIPALFIKMFGDPVENPMGWDKYPLLSLVSDGTRKYIKVQKRDYQMRGLVQIIDQGKSQIGGYIDETEGAFCGPFPTVVFGDHTRRFKLIEKPFVLGADGVKLLEPKTSRLDPVFLFGQCQALDIQSAGYSRHFRFLKMKELILPPVELQQRYTTVVKVVRIALSIGESGFETTSALNASLMNHLLEAEK